MKLLLNLLVIATLLRQQQGQANPLNSDQSAGFVFPGQNLARKVLARLNSTVASRNQEEQDNEAKLISNKNESLCPQQSDEDGFCEDPIDYPYDLVKKIIAKYDNNAPAKLFFSNNVEREQEAEVDTRQGPQFFDAQSRLPSDPKPLQSQQQSSTNIIWPQVAIAEEDSIYEELAVDQQSPEDTFGQEEADDVFEYMEAPPEEDPFGRTGIHDFSSLITRTKFKKPFRPFSDIDITQKEASTVEASTALPTTRTTATSTTTTTSTTSTSTTTTHRVVNTDGNGNQGFIGDESTEVQLCASETRYIYPRRGETIDKQFKFIVNSEGTEYRQVVRIEKCISPGEHCQLRGSLSLIDFGIITACRQKYSYRKLLAVNAKGHDEVDLFKFPSCCVCHQILKSNYVSDGAQSIKGITSSDQSLQAARFNDEELKGTEGSGMGISSLPQDAKTPRNNENRDSSNTNQGSFVVVE